MSTWIYFETDKGVQFSSESKVSWQTSCPPPPGMEMANSL